MARLFDTKNWTRGWASGTARDRLEKLRALAEKQRTKVRPEFPPAHDWRYCRKMFYTAPWMRTNDTGWEHPKKGQFQNKPWFGDTQYVYSSSEPFGRKKGWADELVHSIEHTGWYMDEDGINGTMRGAVFQFPGRDHKPRFYPAMQWSDNDEWIFWPMEITDDETEAARWADHYAERYAEDEREFQRKERAKMDVEQAQEEVNEHLQRRRELKREFNALDEACKATVGATYAGLISQAAAAARSAAKRAMKLKERL